MSRISFSGQTTFEVHHDIFCSLFELEGFGDSPKDEEPVPVDT